MKENAAIADHFLAMPLEVLKRFGRWDDILKEPEPAETFPVARTMRHYERGVAFAAKGDVEERGRRRRRSAKRRRKLPTRCSAATTGRCACSPLRTSMLEGEILFREKKKSKEAIAKLREAVKKEDALRYSEPPDWFVPVRHALGAMLLNDGQADEAENVYRADVRWWPDNGWSLHGLTRWSGSA